ncbi:BMP-binding endothelial regulator protein-like isoform X2 [Amphibalanus amphitrite]|nr:BMP-binding endothelial regulator protein-like isoform X2 [Amphibalanus amphitrite]
MVEVRSGHRVRAAAARWRLGPPRQVSSDVKAEIQTSPARARMARKVAPGRLICLLIVITCLFRSAIAGDLKGLDIDCSNEGQLMDIPSVTDDPCITCRCMNRWVKCDREVCPMADTCHLVLEGQKLRPDSCCEKCKGCQTAAGRFSEGDAWTDPSDPCQLNHCFSGVVTVSKIQCHTPCASPLPAAAGQCCPRCPGCLLSGQLLAPGQNLTLLSDPCVTCRCGRDGTHHCHRQVCPALSCPYSESKREPGQCCDSCTGTRRIKPSDGCVMGKRRFSDGQNFTLDPCTQCSCQGSTSVCARQSCPELACPLVHQVYSPDRCCPVCRRPERVRRVCRYLGKTYEDGESWPMRNPCASCTCSGGQPRCEFQMCPPEGPDCPAGHHAARLAGQCCEQCVEDDAVCTVFGDPHYNTFDGKMYNYQGTCKYQLAKDCVDKSFSIRVNNSPRRSRFFSWTQSATIKAGDLRIALRQKKRVKVNNRRADLPYFELGKVSISQDPDDNYNVVVKLSDLGVSVLWDGDSFLQVKVPPSYKNKMCGLCGNYNGNKTDDFTTRRGRQVKLTRRFARSWLVGARTLCMAQSRRQTRRHRKRKPKSCGGDRAARATAVRQCNRLKSARFADCHPEVHPAPFFKSCVQDMCECGKRKTCYCEALTAYSHACQRKGIAVDWLEGTDCAAPVQCPKSSRPVDCVPDCQPSCEAPSPTGEQCAPPAAGGAPCRPGCVCQEGLLLHEGACVPPERCPVR